MWAKLRSEAYKSLPGRLYTPLTLRTAQGYLQSRSLGFAKLRLLPKRTGKPVLPFHLCCFAAADRLPAAHTMAGAPKASNADLLDLQISPAKDAPNTLLMGLDCIGSLHDHASRVGFWWQHLSGLQSLVTHHRQNAIHSSKETWSCLPTSWLMMGCRLEANC